MDELRQQSDNPYVRMLGGSGAAQPPDDDDEGYGGGHEPVEHTKLPTKEEAADLIKKARVEGSANKADAHHRAAPHVVDDIAQNGSVFRIVGNDGVERVLVQMPGKVNGASGRFEWILDGDKLTHQMFVKNGSINGRPIR